MHPSFTGAYIQPMFSSYTHDINLSKTPHHINTLEDSTIFNEQLQQANLFSDDHSNHKTKNIPTHQQLASHEIRASLQFATGKCSYNNGDDGFNSPKNSSKTRRDSKNNLHSKINTARGPRDRRMRLSLDVAKRFFKLQDMLGFDKASKTVDWLLMKSESNIQELFPHGKSSYSGVSISEYSTSKCEDLSENINDEQHAKCSSNSSTKEKKKTSRGVRKNSYLLRPLAKETREMARKRARERTVEKSSKSGGFSGGDDQFYKFRPCLDQAMDQGVNRLGSSGIINQSEQPSSHFPFKQVITNDHSSSSVIGNWNLSSLFNYQHTGVHAHEHQFNEFQILGNLWEGCN